MNTKMIDRLWARTCQTQYEQARVAAQIKELCHMRDTRQPGIMNEEEIKFIIEELCTR